MLRGSEEQLVDLVFGSTMENGSRGLSSSVRRDWLLLPMARSIEAGHAQLLSTLVRAGAEVSDEMMHPAVRSGNLDVVKTLVSFGASPTFLDENRSAPIHLAASLGHVDAIDFFHDQGVSINALDGRGRTPLHIAVECRELGVVRALLSHGADVTIRCIYTHPYGEYRALDLAASKGDAGLLRLLLQHGTDVDASDSRDRTALHIAAIDNAASAIDVLVEFGANIEARTGSGRTPLTVSSEPERYGAALALLNHGANIHVADDKGNSPLHFAARCAGTGAPGAAAIVDLLLKWGADETAVNGEDHTAAMVIGDYLQDGDTVYPPGDIESVVELLARAPGDRAWRRRRGIVMCRAFMPGVAGEAPGRRRLSRPVSEEEVGSDGVKAPPAELRFPVSMSDGSRRARKRARAGGRGGSGLGDDAGGSGHHGGGSVGREEERKLEDWESAAFALVKLREEGLFRNIVSFL